MSIGPPSDISSLGSSDPITIPYTSPGPSVHLSAPTKHSSGWKWGLYILGFIIILAAIIIIILAALRKFPVITLNGTQIQTTNKGGGTAAVDWPLILVCIFFGLPLGLLFLIEAGRM